MTQSQNLLPDNPSLKDVLDLYGKGLKLDINCHHVGTIQSFDSTLQTAKATVNYKRTYFEPDLVNKGSYKPKLVDYPVLLDCPVVCLGGGNGMLTFPIKPGDECLVLFNDRDFSDWLSSGLSSNPVPTGRIHSFADAVLLVGIRSISNIIPAYATDGVELRTKDGLTSIKVMEDGSKITAKVGPLLTIECKSDGTIKILNESGIDVFAALIQLFTDVQTGLVTTLLGPQPLVMPTFTVDLAVLETYAP